jgi:hypothetical protein
MTKNDGASIVARISPWKFASGVKVDGNVIVDDLGFDAGETIANNGTSEGDIQDNTVSLFVGAHGVLTVAHDLDAAVGSVRLFYEYCDDNSNWPSDATDFVITDLIQVANCPIDNSAVDKSRSVNFVL